MALLWVNPATNNKFGNKHLHVVPGSPSLQALIDEGRRVFAARVEAYRRRKQKSARARALKATYGGNIDVTSNTLIVLNAAGLAALEAAIASNGYKTDHYTVKNGVIFNMTAGSCEEGLVAKLHLAVRTVPGGGHEVWHLQGAELKAKLKSNVPISSYTHITVTSVPGDPGTLGLHYTPTAGELSGALAGLKHVVPRVGNGLPAPSEIGNIKLIDLSFLDD